MPRCTFPVFLLALLAGIGALGLRGPHSTALAALASAAPAETDDAAPAKDAGTIVGRVSSIDYKTGIMAVDVTGGSRKSYDVLVVPGTNIQGNKDFHTIADIKKGARVQVLLSQHGATFTAQIIRLL